MPSQETAIRPGGINSITALQQSAAPGRGLLLRTRAVLPPVITAVFALTLSTIAYAATTRLRTKQRLSTRAHATTTITVTTLSDPTGTSGTCSLRDAITAANTKKVTNGCAVGTGNDTIQFSVSGTILLVNILPLVTDSRLAINGPASPGITIDGGDSVQVMQVESGTTLNLNNLSIARSCGIFNAGTLKFTNSTFSGNLFCSFGGGISNAGTLSVTNSTFSGNSGGVGGGISNVGTATVSNSTFVENNGVPGGGIANFGNGLTVTNTTFSNNRGGAIFSATSLNARPLNVTNSTFLGNSSHFFSSGDGGAILDYSGPASLIKSTVIAGTSGGNCFGTITDAGYNISDDGTCGFAKTGSANNGDNVDPKLSSDGLTNNGGPTETIALAPGSPAIDEIPVADCTDQSAPPKRITTDQRGMPRPDFGEDICDIGAYESQETFAGQPGATNCRGVSVSALSDQFGSIKAAALALGFPSVQALQNAIRAFCRG